MGLTHSDISGSKFDCNSPELFAACHVLHRLSMPRHPSCALSSLTTKKNFTFSCCLSTKFVPLDLAIELLRLYFKTLHSSIVNEPQVSHLPYHPEKTGSSLFHAPIKMVGVLGFEPRTSSLSGTRSNQLSYTPGRFLVELTGIEPATYSLQSYRSSQLSYSPGRSLCPFNSPRFPSTPRDPPRAV